MNRKKINLLADRIREILNLETPINLEETIHRLDGAIQEVDLIENGHEAKVENQNGRFIIRVRAC